MELSQSAVGFDKIVLVTSYRETFLQIPDYRDKELAAMTTGFKQKFHDFKIYNCSSKYTLV